MIHFHWQKKASPLYEIYQLENVLESSANNSDQQWIFTTVGSSFRKIFCKQKEIHIHKFSHLNNQQNRASTTPASAYKKFILNLSKYVLTESEEAVAVTRPHSNLDMACAVESIVSTLPQTQGMEFRWKIRSMLEKSKSSRPNMTTKEIFKAQQRYQDSSGRQRQLHSGDGTNPNTRIS
jgi:hypothetical protein